MAKAEQVEKIAIPADDLDWLATELIHAEEEIKVALACIDCLKLDVAEAFGFAGYRWQDAPPTIRDTVDALIASHRKIAHALDGANRELFKAQYPGLIA